MFTALAGLAVTMPFFIPLSVAVVAGDAIAGEASLGTLRYLLVRPAGRARLLLAKGIVVALYCVVAALVVVVAGLAIGFALFPHGAVVTLSGTTVPLVDGVGRSLLAAAVVGASMFGLASVGLFISTLTDAPIAAMAVTVAVVIVSAIVDGVSEVSFLHPWMLTNYWTAFTDLARAPVQVARDLERPGAAGRLRGGLRFGGLGAHDVAGRDGLTRPGAQVRSQSLMPPRMPAVLSARLTSGGRSIVTRLELPPPM